MPGLKALRGTVQ